MKKYQRKIAVFLPSLVGDGAERVMLNLAGEFARRGVPVGLLLAAAEGPYLKDVPADVWIVDLAAGRIRSSILRDLRHEKPAVLPGFVDNPFQYLSHARLFVLSSRCEGLPTALIKAMAFSTPVVSTNCRNGPIEILDNGRFGAPVPIENAEALATVICAELAKKKLVPPKESWERFDVEHAVDSYLEFLRPPINLHKPN